MYEAAKQLFANSGAQLMIPYWFPLINNLPAAIKDYFFCGAVTDNYSSTISEIVDVSFGYTV